MNELTTVRNMWMLLEPLHAVIYYAPEAFAEAADLGYEVASRWPSYFAWRASPIGETGAHLSTAIFHSFAPTMVAEYVPAVWQVSSPAEIVEARDRAADRALSHILGDRLRSEAVAEAAELARTAANAADLAGRPLAAANSDLPWPEEPHMVLWRASTILREHRGDGHIAALLAAGLGPCESLVSFAATGAAPIQVFASRGWDSDTWNEAHDNLIARQWINADGTATDAGLHGRAEIENTTDTLASLPWTALGPDRTSRLAALAAPLTRVIAASGILPTQSTLGMRNPNGDS